MAYIGVVLVAVGVILLTLLSKWLFALIVEPYIIMKKFEKQGVRGPGYKFWSGNLTEIEVLKKAASEMELDIYSHDVGPKVTPHHHKWFKLYGKKFLYWVGTIPRVCICDVEIIREIMVNKFAFYPKNKANRTVITLLGRGLAMSEGEVWARHRKILTPAFAIDKLKMMTKHFIECTIVMLDNWEKHVDQAEGQDKLIEVNKEFQEVTADIICHTGFSINYAEGKAVFLAQKDLLQLIIANILKLEIPGFNYYPSKFNFQKWKIDRMMKGTLLKLVEKRLKSENYGDDLLGLMLQSSKMQEGKRGLSKNEIVDECKNFFIAGHETTSHLLTWTMFLLSTNPEWQERCRKEVLQECGKEIPNADNLGRFKLVAMVLLETLRLYSPVLMLLRRAVKDMEVGSMKIPKGVQVMVPFYIIHRDKDLWGDDAEEFNPLRFENGITKAAKHPNALLAFSMGPRTCMGQNYALLEAKAIIGMILQRFTFSLSPSYKHKPIDMPLVQPLNGLPIIFKHLSA